ncbi:MAG: hypothetical protein NTV00_12070 [Methylococcales bacterium]|nr:hypothetical protein [Methylococcales bacterium]
MHNYKKQRQENAIPMLLTTILCLVLMYFKNTMKVMLHVQNDIYMNWAILAIAIMVNYFLERIIYK